MEKFILLKIEIVPEGGNQVFRSNVNKEKWGRCRKCFGTGTKNRTSKLLSNSSNADTGGIVATETQECNAIQQYGKRSLIAME